MIEIIPGCQQFCRDRCTKRFCNMSLARSFKRHNPCRTKRRLRLKRWDLTWYRYWLTSSVPLPEKMEWDRQTNRFVSNTIVHFQWGTQRKFIAELIKFTNIWLSVEHSKPILTFRCCPYCSTTSPQIMQRLKRFLVWSIWSTASGSRQPMPTKRFLSTDALSHLEFPKCLSTPFLPPLILASHLLQRLPENIQTQIIQTTPCQWTDRQKSVMTISPFYLMRN